MCKKEALATWRLKRQEKVTDSSLTISRLCSLEANLVKDSDPKRLKDHYFMLFILLLALRE